MSPVNTHYSDSYLPTHASKLMFSVYEITMFMDSFNCRIYSIRCNLVGYLAVEDSDRNNSCTFPFL